MATATPAPRLRGISLPEMFLCPDGLRWAGMIRGSRGWFAETAFGGNQSWRGDWRADVTHHLAWWAGEPALKSDWWMQLADGTTSDRQTLGARIGPWHALPACGVPVYCGGLAAWHCTPHTVLLHWLTDQRKVLRGVGCGWALGNSRGSLGVLDSTRADVLFEDWLGCPLDRQVRTLLQQF